MFRGFNRHRTVVAKMKTAHSRFTQTQRKVLGGERPEFFSLTVFPVILSIFLYLSLLSVVLVFSGNSSVSWFTVYGWWREGLGLLECWHVPIRATVLHYSISEKIKATAFIPNQKQGRVQRPLVVIYGTTPHEEVETFKTRILCYYKHWNIGYVKTNLVLNMKYVQITHLQKLPEPRNQQTCMKQCFYNHRYSLGIKFHHSHRPLVLINYDNLRVAEFFCSVSSEICSSLLG